MVLFMTRLTGASTEAKICTGNLTHELMVFNFFHISETRLYILIKLLQNYIKYLVTCIVEVVHDYVELCGI